MSRRLQHEARRTALLFAAVLLALVCASLVCVPGPAWAANDTATIAAKVRVFQEYHVSVSGLENKFTYLIVPNEDDAPFPLDESGKAFDSFTLSRNEDAWLEFAVPVAVSPSAKAYAYRYARFCSCTARQQFSHLPRDQALQQKVQHSSCELKRMDTTARLRCRLWMRTRIP